MFLFWYLNLLRLWTRTRPLTYVYLNNDIHFSLHKSMYVSLSNERARV